MLETRCRINTVKAAVCNSSLDSRSRGCLLLLFFFWGGAFVGRVYLRLLWEVNQNVKVVRIWRVCFLLLWHTLWRGTHYCHCTLNRCSLLSEHFEQVLITAKALWRGAHYWYSTFDRCTLLLEHFEQVLIAAIALWTSAHCCQST